VSTNVNSAWDGERLRRGREDMGWSRRHLAKIAGISPTNVAAYETNQKMPTLATVEKLATAVGLVVGELLNFRAEPGIEQLRLPMDQESVFDPAIVRIRPTSESLVITLESRRFRRR
jgi:transcriptional regulator with XRE-family HTH domain